MSQYNKIQKEVLVNLGCNIKDLRRQHGISQEELAFKINSARNFIGCIERAEKAPTILTLHRIAQALGVKISALVEDID